MGRPNKTSQAIPQVHCVRLQLSDDIYRAVRHRLVDAGPERSMSDIVAELIAVGLARTEGQP